MEKYNFYFKIFYVTHLDLEDEYLRLCLRGGMEFFESR